MFNNPTLHTTLTLNAMFTRVYFGYWILLRVLREISTQLVQTFEQTRFPMVLQQFLAT